MYIKEIEYEVKPQFLKSTKFTNFTSTVSDELVETNENGRKIVYAGSFLDAEGLVVDDDTAKGILFTDVDVTEGPLPCALMVEGHVLQDRLPVLPSESIKEALKKISFY